MARDSFIFYRGFFDAIRGLGNKTIAEFLMAVADFALDGRMPQNISPVANALFLMAKPQIEANNRRYENGMKGGRPAADENSSRQKKSTPYCFCRKTSEQKSGRRYLCNPRFRGFKTGS